MTRKKGGLNRGLGAFIKDQETINEIIKGDSSKEEIQELKLDEIVPNEDQARKNFDPEALQDLAQSISDHGVIQPILVRKKGDKFEIVAGERRYRASKLVGKDTIPAIVRDMTEYEMESISLIENIQREDLNPCEEANAYKSIINKYQLTQEELAKAIGKSRPYISNTIRLLRLDPRVLQLLEEGKISYSMGRELLSITDGDKQYKKALEIIEKGSSVKEVAVSKKKVIRKSPADVHIVELEEKYMDRLGTKVSLNERKKVITINYYDYEDLQRITEIIVGE